MSEQQIIDTVQSLFSKLYIDAVPLLLNDKGAFLSFSTVFSGTEAIADLYCGASIKLNGSRFIKFIEVFGCANWKRHDSLLWDLRNSLAHNFAPKNSFALTHFHPDSHFQTGKVDGREIKILNAESFFKEFKDSAEAYFSAVQSDANVRAMFMNACEKRWVIHSPNETSKKVLMLSDSHLGNYTNSVQVTQFGGPSTP